MIRKLDKAEFQQATTLALEVYLQCGQDDFEDEGLESFKSFIFNDKLMKFGFWALNIGLALMVLISLLPIGLIQAWASITHGLWFARSEEFMQQPLLQNLRWLRMIGDTILIIGAVAFFWQIVKVLFPKKS